MSDKPGIALLHSPLSGPYAWEPVAEVMRQRGYRVVVPDMKFDGTPPVWKQNVDAAVAAVGAAFEPGTAVAFAGHAGAGQLFGHIGAGIAARDLSVASYVLVDAGFPTSGSSRLEQLESTGHPFAAELREIWTSGKLFPSDFWTLPSFKQLIPDDTKRAKVLEEMQQLPDDYWTETIPDSGNWPDAPVAALLFIQNAYQATSNAAREKGWPLLELANGNHWSMLMYPDIAATWLEVLIDASVGPRVEWAGHV